MTETKDVELVCNCLGGEIEAFGLLVDRYQHAIYNASWRMVNNRQDAEDITQTVFLKAFEKLDSFNPRHKFFSWIYRIMVNETLNFLNRRRQLAPLNDELIADHANPERQFIADEQSEQIQQAIAELGMDNRIVIILRHFVDLPYKDIGEVLGIPEKRVRSRLYTARQLLCRVFVERGIVSHD